MITEEMREELEKWLGDMPKWLCLIHDGIDITPRYQNMYLIGERTPKVIYEGTHVDIHCITTENEDKEPLVRLKEEV